MPERRIRRRSGRRERRCYCEQLVEIIRTEVTLNVPPMPVLDEADGLVAWPGCVLLDVLPVVVLDEEDEGPLKVPVTSTWCPT